MPLLERLRYVCIVSSNLDEFFEVRFADNLEASRRPDTGVTAADIEALAAAAHALVDEQYAVFNDEVMPALAANGIRIVNHADRNEAERRWVERFFETQVRPLLVPVGLDPAHPFPQVANKSLNFIARLGGKDAFGRRNTISIVKVPRVLPRVIKLPGERPGAGLRAADERHPRPPRRALSRPRGRVVLAVPHHARLRPRGRCRRQQPAPGAALGPDDAPLRPGGAARGRQHLPGRALELPARSSSTCAESALYKVNGPVNLVRMNELIDLADAPRLRFAPFTPAWPASLPRQQSMFDRIRAADLMLHQPFESFEPVVQFMREAVADPAVLAIKQTIYRAGSESPLMDLLIEAARRGKEVMAVVELQARFDEEANINWAERLEAVGAQVVYGVVGLKTHAKLLLVTRREDGRLRRYVHLSTGNYNPNTARLYTDIGHFTADPELTADADAVFQQLASLGRTRTMRAMLQAPFTLHKQMLAELARVAAAATAGQPARVVVKINALTDVALIERAGRRRPGRRRHRPDRARRLHAAARHGRRDRADPGALDRRPLPRALAHRLLPLGRRRATTRRSTSPAPTGWAATCTAGSRWPGRCATRACASGSSTSAWCPTCSTARTRGRWPPTAATVASPARGPSAQQALMQRYAGREGLSILNRL